MSQSDQCMKCKHHWVGRQCAAFPDEIPLVIIIGEHDHSQPFDNDKGIRFELAVEYKEIEDDS